MIERRIGKRDALSSYLKPVPDSDFLSRRLSGRRAACGISRAWSADEPAGEAGGDAPGMGEAVRSSLLSRLSCQPRPICVVLWSVELERSAACLMTEQIVLPNGSLMD